MVKIMVPNPMNKWMIWGYHYFWKHPYTWKIYRTGRDDNPLDGVITVGRIFWVVVVLLSFPKRSSVDGERI